MVLQYPFYRQYLAAESDKDPHWTNRSLDEIWGALKSTTKKAVGTLINLNPLRRQAS